LIGDDCRATEGAAPLSIWMARTPSATRSSAFSQLTGSNAAPLGSRMSGEASQPEVSRNSAMAKPLRRRPPLLVGKLRGTTAERSWSRIALIPRCEAQ